MPRLCCPHKMSWYKFPLFLLSARVSVGWCYLLLKCLLKSSGPGVFIVGKLLIVDFISLVNSRLFIFSVVFLCQF